MSKYDLDQLSQLPINVLEEKLVLCRARIDSRVERATAESRDMSPRESDLTHDDRSEIAALTDALQLRTRNAEMAEARGRAIDAATAALNRVVEARSRPTLLVSEQHLREHASEMAAGRPYGAVEGVEMRARVTAGGDLGSAGAWHPGAPNEPRHLISFAGIPISELLGRTAQVPAYTGPVASDGVDEGSNHGEYDAVAPTTLTALRFGRWTEVSALANVVDDLIGINQMHAWGIARDLDALAVSAVEAAAGFSGVSVDLDEAAREAILTVAATVYAAETELVILGQPADLAELTGTTPANSDDLGSHAVRFAGAKIYPTLAATPNTLTVFAPSAFRVFQSPLQSASLIDPASGSHRFGSWIQSTPVAAQIVGSAITLGAS